MKTKKDLIEFFNKNSGLQVSTIWKDASGEPYKNATRFIHKANTKDFIFKTDEGNFSFLAIPKKENLVIFENKKGFSVKNDVLGGFIEYYFLTK
jgi:hypothetical protein